MSEFDKQFPKPKTNDRVLCLLYAARKEGWLEGMKAALDMSYERMREEIEELEKCDT